MGDLRMTVRRMRSMTAGGAARSARKIHAALKHGVIEKLPLGVKLNYFTGNM